MAVRSRLKMSPKQNLVLGTIDLSIDPGDRQLQQGKDSFHFPRSYLCPESLRTC